MFQPSSVFNLHLWGIAAFFLVYLTSRAAASVRGNNASAGTFLRRLGLSATILAVVAAALNYFVNPLGYYPTTLLRPLAFDSRREKLTLWSQLPRTPDVILLGSSRSFTLPPAYLTQLSGYSAFNASFHWGTPRDYVAFLRWLLQRNALPKVVIAELSLDIMRSAPETALEPNDPLREYVADSYDSTSVLRQQVQALWSVTQTEQSIRSLLLEIAGRDNRLYAFDADGLGHFLHPDPPDEAINNYMSDLKPDTPLDNFDQAQVAYLKTLMELCRDQDFQLIFYVPPYHPRLLDFYSQVGTFKRSETELLQMAGAWQDNGCRLSIHDFADAKSFSGTPTMFYDAIHPTEAAGRLMLSILVRDLPPIH